MFCPLCLPFLLFMFYFFLSFFLSFSFSLSFSLFLSFTISFLYLSFFFSPFFSLFLGEKITKITEIIENHQKHQNHQKSSPKSPKKPKNPIKIGVPKITFAKITKHYENRVEKILGTQHARWKYPSRGGGCIKWVGVSNSCRGGPLNIHPHPFPWKCLLARDGGRGGYTREMGTICPFGVFVPCLIFFWPFKT